jgi:hypothetical protein
MRVRKQFDAPARPYSLFPPEEMCDVRTSILVGVVIAAGAVFAAAASATGSLPKIGEPTMAAHPV